MEKQTFNLTKEKYIEAYTFTESLLDIEFSDSMISDAIGKNYSELSKPNDYQENPEPEYTVSFDLYPVHKVDEVADMAIAATVKKSKSKTISPRRCMKIRQNLQG